MRRHQQGVLAVAFNPTSNLIFTGGFEHDILLWVPINVRDPFVHRMTNKDAPHKERIVSIVCPPGTPEVC